MCSWVKEDRDLRGVTERSGDFRKRSRTGQRGSRHRAITLLVNDRQQLCGLHCLEH
jgi:hypothetical protein